MKHAMILMPLLLSACLGADASFKDVQRKPPTVSDATAVYLVKNERPFTEWVAETRKKCEKFGCVE